MNLYHYDPETGRFLGRGFAEQCTLTAAAIAERAVRLMQRSENARTAAQHPEQPIPFPDALDPDEFPSDLEHVWIHPAFTTTVEPPPADRVPEGFFPCFDVETQKWLLTPIATAHGEAEPEIDPLTPEGKEAALEKTWRRLFEEHVDVVARSQGFEDMKDAISYAEDDGSVRLQGLGIALRRWRGVVRDAYTDLVRAIHVDRTQPAPETPHKFLKLLPAFELQPPAPVVPVETSAPKADAS